MKTRFLHCKIWKYYDKLNLFILEPFYCNNKLPKILHYLLLGHSKKKI